MEHHSISITMTKDFQGLNKGEVYNLDSNAAGYLLKQQVAILFTEPVVEPVKKTVEKTVTKTAKKKAR